MALGQEAQEAERAAQAQAEQAAQGRSGGTRTIAEGSRIRWGKSRADDAAYAAAESQNTPEGYEGSYDGMQQGGSGNVVGKRVSRTVGTMG